MCACKKLVYLGNLFDYIAVIFFIEIDHLRGRDISYILISILCSYLNMLDDYVRNYDDYVCKYKK